MSAVIDIRGLRVSDIDRVLEHVSKTGYKPLMDTHYLTSRFSAFRNLTDLFNASYNNDFDIERRRYERDIKFLECVRGHLNRGSAMFEYSSFVEYVESPRLPPTPSTNNVSVLWEF